MPQTNHMQEQSLERFGKGAEELVPELMRLFKTPYRVAVALGVYPNAVRAHLVRRGWAFEGGVWREPEATHEPQP